MDGGRRSRSGRKAADQQRSAPIGSSKRHTERDRIVHPAGSGRRIAKRAAAKWLLLSRLASRPTALVSDRISVGGTTTSTRRPRGRERP